MFKFFEDSWLEVFAKKPREEQIQALQGIADMLRKLEIKKYGSSIVYAGFEQLREAAGLAYSDLGISEEEAKAFKEDYVKAVEDDNAQIKKMDQLAKEAGIRT